MWAERYRTGTMLRALHLGIELIGAQHVLCSRSRIGGIVLLALDERFHNNRRDQPDVVPMLASETAPEVACGPGFHCYDARRLIAQKLLQSGAGQNTVKPNRTIQSVAQT